MGERRMAIPTEDPLWYKDAIIYELHVRSFYDSNGDGIGDFPGLTQKLDYLEDLGITAVWLLPFYPSPLKDDGYDISEYFKVNRDYGTLQDFKDFLKEAHRRGIRVITELVLNHTSDQHPWFQKSRTAKPGSPWRNFYVWSETADKYKEARIIFKDFETSNWAWDQEAKAYYWHRFYSHQPDLNFDNPRVRTMMSRVVDFWLGMGVDGLRLDAVPYLFEREGTNCANLPETLAYLRELRAHMDERFRGRMLLAEANQWPEQAAAYFGAGDISHMAFHFPLMPRIFMALQMEDRFPIVDILEQTPKIPESCQWALFLRNHDELTLEMVTDEERDYMYRIYARDPLARINLGIRRRLAPLLGNDRRRFELMKNLLFSLPGTPVLYYGDEIGMGDNFYLGDRNGVRTPMQWSPDRNAGFSKANPQKLYLPVIIDPEYHYEAVNVENQQRSPSSILWWMKRAIATRKRFKSPGRGTLEFLIDDSNPRILAFLRKYEDETMLVISNLSRFYQAAEFDLSAYSGCVPEEMLSRNRFPVIRESPYVVTVGSHDCLFLLIRKEEKIPAVGGEKGLPEIQAHLRWDAILEGEERQTLQEEILPQYLKRCRWFGGKARTLQRLTIREQIPLALKSGISYLLFLEVDYTEGFHDQYLLPLSFILARRRPPSLHGDLGTERSAVGEKEMGLTIDAKKILDEYPQSLIARLTVDGNEGILYDGACDEALHQFLLTLIGRRKKRGGEWGELRGLPGRGFKRLAGSPDPPLHSQLLKTDQSNTSLRFEDKLYLKLFRRLQEGPHPDREITQYLTETAEFSFVPPYGGSIEYQRPGSAPIVIGLLQGFIPSQSDAWSYTLDAVGRYMERVLSHPEEIGRVPSVQLSLGMNRDSMPSRVQELIEGHTLEMAALLGKRSAQMHLALSSGQESDFKPEPFTILYQRSVYESMRTLLRRVMQDLKSRERDLPEGAREETSFVAGSEERILGFFQKFRDTKTSAMRIRIHGDYHLGQVLYTGKDFYIIDFEGEPARPLTERRWKRSPLRDVAGMIRSFHYAVHVVLLKEVSVRPEDLRALSPWADLWYRCVAAIFLGAYLESAQGALFIPTEKEELRTMLRVFLLEKAIYEVGYELNNRPEWVGIPLRAIRSLIG
jgi:maltose alpha-D-glucosyltransferase / alpha-amylase